ncbi:hypothetical protein [Flavivirga jejuensis]|uniref:Uncharacterized protein n=1 Tax=Flavivirga jejuensis TaxID=870487 RepID=A0ABT8WS70_9FLAO|nr:hypothetical protein [Flavivirga jejuensis]MDO5975850.1 hypothetical protein [Flavivirga jejuensis]
MINYNTYKITKKTNNIILIAPIIMSILMGLLFIFPATSNFGFWLLEENSPVELLTFFLFIIGGIYGIRFVYKHKKDLEIYVRIFYTLFSICLILIAMEEIAWGQWFFHFETPEEWSKINMQGETTLHNLKGMQGHSEVLRIIFGLGGGFGIVLGYFSKFNKISVPPVLFTWFLIIFCHGVIDFIQDIIVISSKYDFAIVKTSEFIELLIAGSSFLYLWLNFKKLRSETFSN